MYYLKEKVINVKHIEEVAFYKIPEHKPIFYFVHILTFYNKNEEKQNDKKFEIP